MVVLSHHFNSKHIDHIHIRAAEADLAVAGSGRCATVTEDVNVRKSNMHGHGAELATVGIVIEGMAESAEGIFCPCCSYSVHHQLSDAAKGKLC